MKRLAVLLFLSTSVTWAAMAAEGDLALVSSNTRYLEQNKVNPVICQESFRADGSRIVSAMLKLENMGPLQERVGLVSYDFPSCEPEVLNAFPLKLELKAYGPTAHGQYVCVVVGTLSNGLRLSARNWIPQNPAACQ